MSGSIKLSALPLAGLWRGDEVLLAVQAGLSVRLPSGNFATHPAVSKAISDAIAAAAQAHALDANPHQQYLTQAEGDVRYDAKGTASTAAEAHTLAADPHQQYLLATEGDQRYDTKGAAQAAIEAHALAANPHNQYLDDTDLPPVHRAYLASLYGGTGKLPYSQIDGSPYKLPVSFATTTPLAATYNAIAGTLTATGGQLVVDGYPIASIGAGPWRILVKDQADRTQNGIYAVTNSGADGLPWVLTRDADADDFTERSGALVTVIGGSTNINKLFLCLNFGQGGWVEVLTTANTLVRITAEGSNANGQWRQYSDGTLEQYGFIPIPAVSSAGGSGYAAQSFPIEFPADRKYIAFGSLVGNANNFQGYAEGGVCSGGSREIPPYVNFGYWYKATYGIGPSCGLCWYARSL